MNYKRFVATFLFILVLTLGLFAAVGEEEAEEKPILEVHFLAVERNDAILIRCGDECAFIDSGAFDYGPICVDYLRAQGVTELKYYIGTHAHADHLGGTGAVVAEFPTDTILVNSQLAKNCMHGLATARQKQALEKAKYCFVVTGDTFNVGAAKIEVMGPDFFIPVTGTLDMAENQNCMVLRVSLGDKSFLLTGDAMIPTFNTMLKRDRNALHCTVYKNAHHNGMAGEMVLQALRTEYVVIQTSMDCPPSREYIDILRARGSTVLVTNPNQAGTTIFYTDGETMRYETANKVRNWAVAPQTLEMKVGNRLPVTSVGLDDLEAKTLMWSTSNRSVAYMDIETGYVYANGTGECVITARAFDGGEREVTVTVK